MRDPQPGQYLFQRHPLRWPRAEVNPHSSIFSAGILTPVERDNHALREDFPDVIVAPDLKLVGLVPAVELVPEPFELTNNVVDILRDESCFAESLRQLGRQFQRERVGIRL
jgi:hypothetical protein